MRSLLRAAALERAPLVALRDLREALSDLRLSVAMGGLALVIPLGSAAGIRGLAAFGGGLGPAVERLTVVGAFFVAFLPASYSMVLALESFAGERERTTLEVLLSTPLREAEIYVGKVASVLTIALVLCYGALAIYCLTVFPGLGFFPGGVLISLALSTICQVAAMVAGAVIVSAHARTMRAANVMASFIILPMSVVLQMEAALILLGRAELLWGFAALMALAAVILLRMGLTGFSREALLARDAGGGGRLRRLRSSLAGSLRSGGPLPALVWARRLPVGIAAAGFPLGAGIGFLAGASHALPDALARPLLSAALSSAGGSNPAAVAGTLFAQNLLGLLLGALLAPVTVGLAGFALTFLPGFSLGYVAAASSWPLALGGLIPAGLLELPAVAIAGGLLIQVGACVIHMEPEGGWASRVLRALGDYVRALVWLVPALAVAALLEAYIG